VDDGRFVLNLSAPSLSPGTSGSFDGWVHDPLAVPLSAATLTFTIYAFEPFPGGAANTSVPLGAHVQLVSASGSGSSVTLSFGTLQPGAPVGAYAVSLGLAFMANGSNYWMASRGHFSAAEWLNATSLPRGNSTLNLSRLGVSGVIPETAVQVQGSSVAPWLYLLLGASLVLAAAGGFYAIRRGPKSRSGANLSPEESNALSAFGNRRRRDGD
ncbi:MAG: hypothetical protein L3J96_06465, partial [Thermoplasmata archaeon]|nr:hypothetical protein [Thermoplasmata archaeon]